MGKVESDELQSILKERREIVNQFRILAAFALVVFVVGAVVFHRIEHWSWINSFYFCTVTLTTVGYGDLTPTTNAAKLFDIFYILIGIGVVAGFVNAMIKNAVIRRQIKQIRKKK